MDAQKQQAIDRLNTANNILVTVSRDPSVDQLSAAIGITLLLNKLGKHATAVYSGKTPSTIEFLQPEKTIEKNTDSLRDFIIALDKSKADKLRYKVEDQMVKIFITPYRTSISDKDLEFSQGDFNVEVVLALGVARQQDLDQAITSHGRILHDATVIGVGTQAEEEALGSINWVDAAASSLSEMMTHLGLALDDTVLDAQMATALLTGIVAETERFSNKKTTAETMQASAKLMEAGANQQLVASELATPEALGATLTDDDQQAEGNPEAQDAVVNSDGSLVIEHSPDEEPPQEPDTEALELPEPEEQPQVDEIKIDYDGQMKLAGEDTASPKDTASLQGGSRLILQPPAMGGTLTANSEPEGLDPAVDPLSAANVQPLLHRNIAPLGTQPAENAVPNEDVTPKEDEAPKEEPAPQVDASSNENVSQNDAKTPDDHPAESHTPATTSPTSVPDTSDTSPSTLSDLEKFVSSPHLTRTESQEDTTPKASESSDQDAPEEPKAPEAPPTDVSSARDAVEQAMNNTAPSTFEPVKSLNAMPVDLDLGDIPAVNTSPASAFTDSSAQTSPPEMQPVENASVTQAPAEFNAPGSDTSPNEGEQPSTSPHDMHVASDPGLPPGLITNEPVDITAAPNANATSSPAVPPSEPPPPEVPPPMMPPNLPPPAGQNDQMPHANPTP